MVPGVGSKVSSWANRWSGLPGIPFPLLAPLLVPLSAADAESASEARARARRVGIAAVGIREKMLIA